MSYFKRIAVSVKDDASVKITERGAGIEGIAERGVGIDGIAEHGTVGDGGVVNESGILYITDDVAIARSLRAEDKAVVIYLHEGNASQDFSDFLYAVEDPENLSEDYVERVYRRFRGLPWKILETERCIVRETTVEDVEAFYEIYSHPSVTEHMEGLYPDVEEEKQYVRDYIAKVYTFYEFGVWTVLEKSSGAVIGRAGLSCREGYEEPELGFIIGVPWQRKGYAEEVCRAILQFGREELGFEKIQVLVEPENEPSLRLCRKLGFCGEEENEIKGKKYIRMLTE